MRKPSFGFPVETPTPTRTEMIPFFLVWHRSGLPRSSEMLSLSASKGQFRPFEDQELCTHLKFSLMTSIQHLDLTSGVWLSILRSSPPIRVRPDAIVHLKEPTTDVDLDSIIAGFGVRQRKEVTISKREEISLSRSPSSQTQQVKAVDSGYTERPREISTEDSPSPKRKMPWTGDDIGSRPCRIPRFGKATVGEMSERFEWMHANRTKGTLADRFNAVFAAEFKSSTFHHHHLAWKSLKENGQLTAAMQKDKWLDHARTTWKTEKNNIDLSELEGTGSAGAPIDLTDQKVGIPTELPSRQ